MGGVAVEEKVHQGGFVGIILVREVGDNDCEYEVEELGGLSKETREKGVSWKSLKADLGLRGDSFVEVG